MTAIDRFSLDLHMLFDRYRGGSASRLLERARELALLYGPELDPHGGAPAVEVGQDPLRIRVRFSSGRPFIAVDGVPGLARHP